MRRLSLIALLAAGVLAAAPSAQQAVFKAGVQTVPLYATVVDANGRLVPDLEQEHFELFDNGKAQKITFFRSDVQPISVVVALDTSGSMTMNLDLVKNAAEAFVLRLLPHDRARMSAFDDKLQMMDAFSSNRDELVRYLHTDMQFGNGTRLWDSIDQAISALAKEQNRRVILVLTDGADTGSARTRDEVLAHAQQDDLMIYAIGLHSRYRGGVQGSMIETKPDGALKKLAEDTGGGYFELTKTAELNSTFTRVADELHRQYVIGFSPEVLDGKLHRLDLRVKVQGMVARARKSYIASANGSGQ